EILDLNVKEAGKSMPPDVKEALLEGINALDILILLESGGWAITRITSPFRPGV
ncbi:unnamed protein product, partial [marine sediment metagenome]